mmetsp:Transcript_17253/g.25504  ORF Transcript_17253/g.25504 Transcript_17253/m.25504 type:complete len:209 (+) Transcript_17253:2439-3065(+)
MQFVKIRHISICIARVSLYVRRRIPRQIVPRSIGCLTILEYMVISSGCSKDTGRLNSASKGTRQNCTIKASMLSNSSDVIGGTGSSIVGPFTDGAGVFFFFAGDALLRAEELFFFFELELDVVAVGVAGLVDGSSSTTTAVVVSGASSMTGSATLTSETKGFDVPESISSALDCIGDNSRDAGFFTCSGVACSSSSSLSSCSRGLLDS